MSDELKTILQADDTRWEIRNNILYGPVAQIVAWTNHKFDMGAVDHLPVALGILKPDCDLSSLSADNLHESLAGGVYFFNALQDNGWSNIEICVALVPEVEITPRIVREILGYPFNQGDYRRVTAKVLSTDKRAKKQLDRLGFEECGWLSNMGPQGQEVTIYQLLPCNIPDWVKFEFKEKEEALS